MVEIRQLGATVQKKSLTTIGELQKKVKKLEEGNKDPKEQLEESQKKEDKLSEEKQIYLEKIKWLEEENKEISKDIVSQLKGILEEAAKTIDDRMTQQEKKQTKILKTALAKLKKGLTKEKAIAEETKHHKSCNYTEVMKVLEKTQLAKNTADKGWLMELIKISNKELETEKRS